MYTIRQVAALTGFSPDTLRYYEKIGLLPSPQRGPSGKRTYNDDNVRQLVSIRCLKKTGLSLEAIKDFISEGQCFANHSPSWTAEELHLLASRQKILSTHLDQMEKQRRELDALITETKQKLDYYKHILLEQQNDSGEVSE
ncbi:UNVERIFIED_CONTAM: DNA-binding transcriptional MerR regulator [Brevibacillus sp. OAP136]